MRLKLFLIVIIALGAVSAILGASSLAIFTDSQDVGSNTFTTGSVDISASPASAVVTYSNMAPGDIATGNTTISNAGSLELRYAMTTATTNTDGKNLAGTLKARIGVQGGAGCDFPYYNADGTTTSLTDDTQLSEGILSSAAFGSIAQGNQAGDRTLAAAGSEVLCMSVVLPSSTGNALQSATTTATFTFDAEQTANNP
ncbi:MAG: TasA family protein [Dehalococcoidia bacterium]